MNPLGPGPVVHRPGGVVPKICLACRCRWPCPYHRHRLAQVRASEWDGQDPFDAEGDDLS